MRTTKASERERLSREIMAVAASCGAECTRTVDGRRTRVGIRHSSGATVGVTWDGGSCLDCHVLSWHLPTKTTYRFSPSAFQSVNAFHGCKATDCVDGAQLADLLRKRLSDLDSGAAFVAQQ